ncbi:MAG: cell surface protein SprA, partial [Saprospiraceae bacterium]|nr:cell surface protein SprA [Saprospiraceae bacterium]
LAQRQREEIIQYDLSTNLELGKLLPEKSGVKLPFYAQYSNVTKNPEYDPYDLDIKLKDKIRDEPDPVIKDQIKEMAQDVTIVRGYNFTNVRKEHRGKPRKVPLPWNIENFSLTYAFNQQKNRSPFIQSAVQDQYKGAIDWQYSTGMKPIKPFKSLIKKDKFLKFITEFNFNPLPETYGFSTNLERLASVTTYRFAGEDPELNTYYNRRFTWDRNYDLGWTIAQSLRFNFDATARSLIDEPLEYEDGRHITLQERRQILWENFLKLGRPKGYTHSASLNWTLPFKVIPYLEWINMKASYTAGYTWTAQSLKLQNFNAGDYQDLVNERSLGNVIQNTNTRQINGDFNLEQLYNKSKYLKKINSPGSSSKNGNNRGRNSPSRPGMGNDAGPLPGGRVPAGNDKSGGRNNPTIDRNMSKNPADPRNNNPQDNSINGGKDPAAGGGPGGIDPSNPSDPNDPASGGASKGKSKKDKKKDKKSKEKKDRDPSLAERIALRPLMLIRKARFNYTENYSTVIPGFTPDTKLMGLSEGFDAPGWAFIAGVQPRSSWLDEAGQNGWITHRPELNQQVLRNYTQSFDAALTIEPFKDFRVEVTANKQYTRNSTELFKDQNFALGPDSVAFEHRAMRDMGSYTISYFSLQTLFDNDINGIFERYEQNRPVISKRLGVDAPTQGQHETDIGYAEGFGKIQQQVLIPAFISAYTKADPNTVQLDIFKTLPSVNWKLSYNGLNKLGNLKDIFASIQISHGYKNTLTVNSYNTDLFFDPTNPYQIDELNYNYVARYEIPQIVINEQLQPLFGIDVKLKNEMTFKADFKKTRSLAMSFIDYQLAESRSTSYSAGFGYRLKDVNIPFLTGKKKGKSKKSSRKSKKNNPPVPLPGRGGGSSANDMTFKFDFEVRDDITTNHLLDSPNKAVPTRGARTVSINPSVEYA